MTYDSKNVIAKDEDEKQLLVWTKRKEIWGILKLFGVGHRDRGDQLLGIKVSIQGWEG